MLHDDIFKLITFSTMIIALYARIFSDNVARFILTIALLVCGLWAVANTIILAIRIKNRENMAASGFGMMPVFLAIPTVLVLGLSA